MAKAKGRVFANVLSAAQKAWETRRNRAKQPAAPKKKVVLKPHEPINMPKQPPPPATTAEMIARTVVMVLTVSGIGNRRKVNPNLITVDADKAWLSLSKKLYDSEELDEITSIGNKARMYVMSRALPYTIKEGVYLLPTALIEEVDARLTTLEAERKPLVESMIHHLDGLTAEAKTRLKDLFDATQYPTANQLRAAFCISWRYVHVDSAPKSLELVSKELYEKERKKAEAEWKETRETIQQVLRANLSEMVNHMVDRLSPNEHNEKKMFKESAIQKFQDFLGTFDSRNITNDVQMKILVDKAKSLISSTNTETLRTHQATRDHVLHGFETIKALLDPMIVNVPHRAIKLEE